MTTIKIICEGQTETDFVKKILCNEFDFSKYLLTPITVNSVKGNDGKTHKGGIQKFLKVDQDIQCTMKSVKASNTIVTTMFDYYALPKDFPGVAKAKKEGDVYKKINIIESELCAYYRLKFSACMFVPYIQLHEFETLLFTDIAILKRELFDKIDTDNRELENAVKEFKNIELINGGNETAPSKRIKKFVDAYDKRLDGMKVLQKIPFDKICRSCRHFNDWITKLKNI